MTRFWLHVLRPDPKAASFTVALSRSPNDSAAFGAPLPTRSFDSWEPLAAKLSFVGISQSDLEHAQQNLKAEHFHTFRGIVLTDDQPAVLGSGSRSGSASH